MDYSNVFVCLMGLGTVFFGLACLIALCYLLSWACKSKQETDKAIPAAVPAGNRQEMVAAISAALAEEVGTDITGIRILSITKK